MTIFKIKVLEENSKKSEKIQKIEKEKSKKKKKKEENQIKKKKEKDFVFSSSGQNVRLLSLLYS